MAPLTRIYTKAGDGGETALGDGRITSKWSPRVEAYGTVDEANAQIGQAIAALATAPETAGSSAMVTELRQIQNDLLDAGADLSTPIGTGEGPADRVRVSADQVRALETLIDRRMESLPPLSSFVLPGGSEAAARLHVARTVVRRAERRVAAVIASEPALTNREVLVYLNRLSDLLFVMARAANDGGASDVLWARGRLGRSADAR